MCEFLGGETYVRNESEYWDICTSSRPINWERFEHEHIC